MELKDFVAATLTQICEGIQKARENTMASGAIIAPRVDDTGLTAPKRDHAIPAQMIHFEVLLESHEEAGSEGGVKVAVGFLSVGGKANNQEAAARAHKVSFDVPLVWPEL